MGRNNMPAGRNQYNTQLYHHTAGDLARSRQQNNAADHRRYDNPQYRGKYNQNTAFLARMKEERTRRRLKELDTGHRRLVNGTSGPKTVKSSITPERWALMKEQDRLENIEKIKKQGAVRADLYTGHRRLVNGTSGPKTVKSSITPERWALMKEQDRLENIEKIKKQGAVRADLYTGHRRLVNGTSGPKTVKSSITQKEWANMQEQTRLENIEKIKRQGAVPAYAGHRRLVIGMDAGFCEETRAAIKKSIETARRMRNRVAYSAAINRIMKEWDLNLEDFEEIYNQIYPSSDDSITVD